jgi:hypothetical protein
MAICPDREAPYQSKVPKVPKVPKVHRGHREHRVQESLAREAREARCRGNPRLGREDLRDRVSASGRSRAGPQDRTGPAGREVIEQSPERRWSIPLRGPSDYAPGRSSCHAFGGATAQDVWSKTQRIKTLWTWRPFSFSVTQPLPPIISEAAWLKRGRLFSIPAQIARYAVLRSASGIQSMQGRRFRPSGAFRDAAHIAAIVRR